MSLGLTPDHVSSENFGFMREFMQREAAIVVEPGKEYLIETRLAPIATERRFESVNDFIDHLRRCAAGDPMRTEAISALTTNETYFFRDVAPFQALREVVLPDLISRRAGAPLHLWSAASSTGQEAYSVAMILADHFPAQAARILGTDLCPTIVERARAGIYHQLEVNRGLPAKLLLRHFVQERGDWQVSEALRRRVEFREMNLARPWPPLPAVDVLLLRNVMIYFDIPTRRQILRQVKNVLRPGGYLVLGGAETTVTLDPDFRPVTVGPAVFFQL